MQDKEEERSLINVEKRLDREGFIADFKVTQGKLCVMGTDKMYAADEVQIVDFYRFEGDSDPDDMSILYAIETSDGVKGTISNSYGTYADTNVDSFLKKVEDLGKNLDKKNK